MTSEQIEHVAAAREKAAAALEAAGCKNAAEIHAALGEICTGILDGTMSRKEADKRNRLLGRSVNATSAYVKLCVKLGVQFDAPWLE
jgi:hypothetical protein